MIYKKLGDLIEVVDERNTTNQDLPLVGLTIEKKFIDSVANTIGTNMSSYKIIRRGEFACSLMQVRRDKKLPIAYLQTYDSALISAAYNVFKLKSDVIPEFAFMWFSRKKFDEEACFCAIGGVRGSLDWQDFINMEIPVPSIEEQKEIVRKYKVITDRIKVLTEINQKLEETANAVYKKFMESADFKIVPILDIADIKYGKGLQKDQLTKFGYPVYGANGIIGFFSEYLYAEPQILVSCRGTVGNVLESLPYSYITSNSLVVCVKNKKYYELTKRFLFLNPPYDCATGSVQAQITIDNLSQVKLPYVSEDAIEDITGMLQKVSSCQLKNTLEIQKLTELKDVLLPKLMTGDIN